MVCHKPTCKNLERYRQCFWAKKEEILRFASFAYENFYGFASNTPRNFSM